MPNVPPETDSSIMAWMKEQGWVVAPARFESDPVPGFQIWQEQGRSPGTSHAIWVAEPMVRQLSAEKLVDVLEREEMAQEIRISLRVRIEGRGTEYRISVVPRRSGEWPRQE
ncbi:MAG TPA: hypothetical protein VGP44_11145 [Gemmatimonadales bacterium]|nr:hypothetical protein [Gemmatimonadales bacterium]